MDKYDYWAHHNPKTKVAPWYFLSEINYEYQAAGENLAFDYNTSKGVCQGWMESLSHRKNLLNPSFTEVGFFVKRVNLGENGIGNLIVQFLATPIDSDTSNHKAIYYDKTLSCYNKSTEIKINSPECGYYNQKRISTNIEIPNKADNSISLWLDNKKLDLTKFIDNDQKTFNQNLSEGHHLLQIKKDQQILAKTEFVIDTIAPIISSNSLVVDNSQSNYQQKFEINLIIDDDHLEIVEIYYPDQDGEFLSKQMQYLGDNQYFTTISYPLSSMQDSFPASIVAIDKAQNSTNIKLDLFPKTMPIIPLINYGQYGQYLALLLAVLLSLGYGINLYLLSQKKVISQEIQHHHYVQFTLAVLMIIVLIFYIL